MPVSFALLCVLSVGRPVLTQAPPPEILPTVAESSGFRATARYDQVTDFCATLADLSEVVRIGELGKTSEGRSIPLIILSDPPVASPEEARKSGRTVVFAFANIHAGEVCGKEALLMLARRIALTPHAPLLRDLIIVLAPIYNADGNEPMSPDNRPGQNGPEEGMGRRPNAQGLDLNRDHVKLESPEARSLARFLTRWDPSVVIDCHTTNGSHHRYTLTYDGPRNPAGNADIIEYARARMLPEVGRRLLEESGYDSFFYGNFNRDHTVWDASYPAMGRYSNPYVGLRDRIGILSEAYAYAPFKDRVLATRDFVNLCLEYTARNHETIRALIRAADQATINAGKHPSDGEPVPIRCKTVAYDDTVTVKGYVEEMKGGRPASTGVPRDYEVEHVARYVPELSVRRPFAYVLPSSFEAVARKLQEHGIKVEELHEDVELDVEVYDIDAIQRPPRAFQGHRLVRLDVSPRFEARFVRAGTFFVRTAQPLGNLVVYVLEPACEDGLAAWGFFDDAIEEGGSFPVVRVPDPVSVRKGPMAPLPRDRGPRRDVTYEALYGKGPRPNLSGGPTPRLTWLEDGAHYLEYRDGRFNTVDALTGRSEAFFDVDKAAAALARLDGLNQTQAKRLVSSRSLRMTSDRAAALVDVDRDLYRVRLDGSGAVRLTRTKEREQDATFSPDGTRVAFTRAFNLYVVDAETQTERALTTDGSTLIRNGRADWVYYEELFDRSWRSYWWAPDSAHVAFLRIDDSPVRPYPLIDHVPTRPEEERTRFPNAGDPNPTVRLGIADVVRGGVTWVDLSAYDGDDILITHVTFTPDGRNVVFYVQDRIQTWLDMNTAPVAGGAPVRVLRQTTPAWVKVPGDPIYLKDGSFLLADERTGWRHLVHFGPDGTRLADVTSGPWEVRDVPLFDEASGWVYLSGTRDNPIGSDLYRVRVDGSAFERLTDGTGTHHANVSPNGAYFIDSASSHAEPPSVRLYRTDGTFIRAIAVNPIHALGDWRLGEYRLVHIKTRDGFVLEGSLLLPPDFDPRKKYPVWFQTYGGPHAPTIRDSWRALNMWDQMLARMGIIVFRADPRSASGKGAQSTWTAYRRLGVGELADIEEAIRWLIDEHPYVDASRIGMSGHSYGGFLTAYALTHSTLFSAGIAGAPVTDWRNYDTIYTERYMDTPRNNTKGYDETSVVKAAANLHGRLLIVHGTIDNNVHMQNTLQLVRELQLADKDFEMMLYPGYRHGIWGSHYRRLRVDFIRKTMKPDLEVSVSTGEPPTDARSGADVSLTVPER